jgi:glucuronoarabinoxylan endo-1,4-beta-xylanase
MKKHLLKSFILFCISLMMQSLVFAQIKSAGLKVNSAVVHQKITGFGGFVNSPQFGYNYMTEAEIRKLWGKNSEAGYNIMRLYLPTGEANWAQSLNTAKLAKSLGLTIFASPWSMPTEWKTYNVIGSRYDDNGVKRDVYLKEEHYEDYAKYLNKYVTYLRDNGVELDAISLQNEPDYQVDYAGCIFTPAQMTKFLKENAHLIDCKIIAPETVGMTDNYANALNDPAVLSTFEIYGGHQYGSVQAAFKNLQAQGKEAWMTEFLINWNSDSAIPSRNASWTIDGFSFAKKLNEALLANVNAWIHYASKRYYGMMGDGSWGTTTGEITKRGHILSHYAKYVTGAKRVENTWNDNSNALTGSSYLSVTGDSVMVVVINPSSNTYSLTVDLPFYSKSGKGIVTTESVNMSESSISIAEETVRPKVAVSASSVTTFIFVKSKEREVSQMAGSPVYYDKIEIQTVTNTAFGTAYQMSGKTLVLKNDSPLISANTTSTNGYLQLGDKYNRLVFHVNSLSSTLNYTSANTTLYYINSAGAVRSYNYGTVTFDKRTNFDWVLDISTNTLTDGCSGVIGLRNGNFSSVLTFNFGDVYFAFGSEKGYKFTGVYSAGDSNLMDSFEDAAYTSLDFTGASAIPTDVNWNGSMLNKNSVFYVQEGALSGKTNVIAGAISDKLELTDGAGNFYAPTGFTANAASYRLTLNGRRMLVLPFEANIPVGIKAYTLVVSDTEVKGTQITNGKISANTPVVITGSGTFDFQGSGSVSSPRSLKVGVTNGVYVGVKAPVGSYYLNPSGTELSFERVANASQFSINAFGAYLTPGSSVTAGALPLKLEEALPVRLAAFSATLDGTVVRLSWNTFSETNNTGFEVERRTDGTSFETIGFVAGKGNSTSLQRYTFQDRSSLAANNYYRLKQIDENGDFHYSEVKLVTSDLPVISLQLYPVPAEGTINIRSGDQAGTMAIFDATGRVVSKVMINRNETIQKDISALPSGVYFYRLNAMQGSFVKN